MSSMANPDGIQPGRNGDREREGLRQFMVSGGEFVPEDEYPNPSDDPAGDNGREWAYDEETGHGDGFIDDGGRDDPIFATAEPDALIAEPLAPETVLALEQERFGGIKLGSTFFGWLTAAGMASLLTLLVSVVGTATGAPVHPALQPVGGTGNILLLGILFLAYYSGGYVSGRMARFNGGRQGLMVWLWTILVGLLVAMLGLLMGKQSPVVNGAAAGVRAFLQEDRLNILDILAKAGAVGIAAAVALIAALLGGAAGTRYHRKVDAAGFTPTEDGR